MSHSVRLLEKSKTYTHIPLILIIVTTWILSIILYPGTNVRVRESAANCDSELLFEFHLWTRQKELEETTEGVAGILGLTLSVLLNFSVLREGGWRGRQDGVGG